MYINRNRPQMGDDLELWFSTTINDAMRDCRELGLSDREMCFMLLSLAKHAAYQGCVAKDAWERCASWKSVHHLDVPAKIFARTEEPATG